jgi:hypothetical protein
VWKGVLHRIFCDVKNIGEIIMGRLGRLTGGIALASLSFAAVPAHAAESSLSLYFSNTYIWRGINLNDSGVMQFSLDTGSISLGENSSLNFNVWGNMDLGDFDGALHSGDFSELDLTVSLSLPAGFSVGYIEYHFPSSGLLSTRELFASWSKDLTISPSVALYYDVDEVEDFYATVALGYSYALSEKASLDLSALAGIAGEDFAGAYSGGTEGGFYNFDVNAGVSFQASETVSLSAVLGYGDTLNEDALPDALTQGFYFGAALGVSF